MSSPPAAPRPPILARVSDRATVVEVHDRLYLRVDAEGRWAAFGEGGALFRRTVEGRVVRPVGSGFEACSETEAAAVEGWVVRRAGELLEALAESRPEDVRLLGSPDRLRERLRRAACIDPGRRRGERDRFREAYPEPVPVLPPHRYRDLVVMPATGCPNHRCTFCALYRDRPFRVLDPDAFRAHLEAVGRLFGSALAERDGVFLGSASALTLPDAVLLDRLADVRRVLGRPRRGIASFHDPDRGPDRTADDWARLGRAGLTEATLGLETGLGTLRREVGKGGDLARIAAVVAAQKAAGLGLSFTVLLGLGGVEVALAHRRATVDFLASLPLASSDRIYLAPLRGGCDPAWLGSEAARWREGLAQRTPARVGAYRIDRFAWLA